MTFVLADAERAFLVAAVDTLIPADELSPSGSECGVVSFMVRELAGPWGEGARLYRDGPFPPGKPEHGYQLGLSPRELFRAGMAAADAWCQQRHGRAFCELDGDERFAAMQSFEDGSAVFPAFASKDFFEALLNLAMEGFFADPIHGGNRNCASWRMIGYPGQPANYRDAIAHFSGQPYDRPPRSLADVK